MRRSRFLLLSIIILVGTVTFWIVAGSYILSALENTSMFLPTFVFSGNEDKSSSKSKSALPLKDILSTKKEKKSTDIKKDISAESPPPKEEATLHAKEVVEEAAGEVTVGVQAAEQITVQFFDKEGCEGTSMEFKSSAEVYDIPLCGRTNWPNGKVIGSGNLVHSVRVSGSGELDLYQDCNLARYWSTVMAIDDCVNVYDWPKTKGFRIRAGESLKQPPQLPDRQKAPFAKYNVVFSCESSEYFGYQVQTSLYAFETSNQKNAVWTRLITAGERDDLVDIFPTFQAKRHPYSRRYGPLNKADVLAKWVVSTDAPREDVVVIIDPDNWLLQDLSPIVKKVSPGHAVAQRAWFSGSSSIQKLWEAFCRKNCETAVLDHAAVPYFVHRDDLTKIAPVFKEYILLMKRRFEHDKQFERRFTGIQIDWGCEMFGWIFATAELGIKVEIRGNLQVRDVSGSPKKSVPMLHMGRAWFPKTYKGEGLKWLHSDQGGFGYRGQQVWCKCNNTASDELPWPVPPETDFQSNATLTLLHHARERYGEIPKGTRFRKHGGGYHQPMM